MKRTIKEIKEIYTIIEESIVQKIEEKLPVEEDQGILKGLRIVMGEDWHE